MKLIKKHILILSWVAILIATLESCDNQITFKEDTLGPYVTVCVESYQPYYNTFKLIDSLKNELKALNVETEKSFGIFYERTADRNNTKFHSIVGCILKNSVGQDSVEIIKLQRNKFMVRTIGATKSMYVRLPFEDFSTPLRANILHAIDNYIQQNNYLPIPNGINGIMEVYDGNDIIFSAEIRPSR